MSRPIVNTSGQGLAASDGLKAAIGAGVTAIVVLLIFYFLNHSSKAKAASFAPIPVAAIAQSF